MNNSKLLLFPIMFVALLALSCQGVTSINPGGKTITPSGVIITEEREIGDFSGIDMRAFGKIILSQGERESLTIEGSDNIVDVIQTSVRGGTLVIQTKENLNITNLSEDYIMTFTIVVKDLDSLTISGAADIEMDSLSTSKLDITMSGAGQLKLDDLMADSLNITLSGVGNVDVSGGVTTAQIDIPGAGNVAAADLEIQTADVNISGFGSATVWVTDQLTGSISGGGDVSYYGDPRVDTQTSGLGQFENLGDK